MHGAERNVTLKEIAARLGVSAMSVSLVLKGGYRKGRISEALVKRILDTASEMGYVPDLYARRMRDRGCRHLQVSIFTSYEAPVGLVGTLLKETDENLRKASGTDLKFHLNVEFYHAGKLNEVFERDTGVACHGAIISNTVAEDDVFLEKKRPPFPVVMIGRKIKGYSSVGSESASGGDKAASVLAKAGCVRPVLLRPRNLTQTTRSRSEAFLYTFKVKTGIRPKELIAAELSEASAYRAVMEFLSEGGRPDGMFMISDIFATGAYKALKDRGLRIPQDVKLVGCDMMPFTPYLDPPLSSVAVPHSKIQKEASNILLGILRGDSKTLLRKVFRTEIVLRESTGQI